ncbi:MAG: TIGR03067 domain-containing protein [Acidobacteriia bacterium]|nr:TIGR03067 domain-containing protein [Terriglobia bacterium]
MHQDLDLLQGTWTVTALEVEGQKMPAAMLAAGRIVIAGDRFTSTGMGVEYQGTLTLDATASPRKIDMNFDAGPETGNSNPGIYELEGDTLRLCIATRGGRRPSGFASTPGSGLALETLVRGGAAPEAKSAGKARASQKAAAAPAEPTSSAPATEFEGEWRMVSGVMDGKPMEQSAVQWVKRVTRGNETTVLAGPQVMLQVEFTTDPSQSPKAIDYRNLAGANKGKVQFGIYEYAGDVLRFNVAAPGAARPADFQGGPGYTLTEWKRA